MIVSGGSGAAGDFFYVLAALARAGWKYRSEMAPLYALGAVIVTGAWLHSAHPGWWPYVAGLGLAGAAFVVFLPRRVAARWQAVARRQDRYWAVAFVTCVSAWLTAATITGPDAGPMRQLAIVATLGLGVPWWLSRERRAKVRVRRVMEHFGDTAATSGLEGAEMVSAVVEPWGWTARLRLRRGQHAKNAVDAVPALESALGTAVGAVTIETVPTDAAQVVLRVIQTDPHAKPIPYPGVPAKKRSRSITQPLTLGVWEDGTPVRVSLLRRHALIGGTTGSGKSGLLNVILAGLVECGDVIAWGIDLKEGMELTPWRSCLQRLATNAGDATAVLQAAVTELENRAAYLTARGLREWVPSASAPALAVVIDEYAELPPAARRLADSIARRGRAVAVTLLVATQRPTQKAMGEGTAIRSQIDVRLCLRVRERGDVDLILGSGMLGAGWDTTGFDAPGKFLLSAPGHDTPRRARAYWITDTEVTRTATRNARPVDQPTNQPHDRPQDGSAGVPGAHAGQTPHDGSQPRSGAAYAGPNHTGTGAAATTATSDEATSPDVVLWQALTSAPPQGVSRARLLDLTQMTSRTLTRRLQAAQAAGVVEQVSRGYWRATPSK